MKIWASLALLFMIIWLASANLMTAASPEQIAEFRETHEDELAALLFFDSSDEEEADLIDDLTNTVMGSDTSSNDMLDIMMQISSEVYMLGVDVSKAEYAETVKEYNVEGDLPKFILFSDDVPAL